MTPSLQEELRQQKPFRNLEVETVLNVVRTAARFENEMAESLKPFGLTTTQYNVLRILRGSGEQGLCRYEVGDRLLAPVPDVTRLLDRLEHAGLVQRTRDPEDRRQVRGRITEKGLKLLAELDQVFDELHRGQVGHLGQEKLRQLSDLLSAARSAR